MEEVVGHLPQGGSGGNGGDGGNDGDDSPLPSDHGPP